MTQTPDTVPADGTAEAFPIVAAACSAVLHPDIVLDEFVGPDTDWDNVVALAARHRVTALVAYGFAQSSVCLPPAVADFFKQTQMRAQHAEAMSAAEVSRLVAAFETQSIQTILLKGIGVSLAAFGQLGLRYNRDIDLLVDPKDVDQAETILGACGYTRIEPVADYPVSSVKKWRDSHKDSVFYHSTSQSLVELHWRLFDNRHLLKLPAGIWGETAEVAIRGLHIRSLPRIFDVCYLCVHGSQHAWSRLKWLVDVDGIVSKLSPVEQESMLAIARTLGVERAVAQAMLLREQILHVPLAPAIRNRLPNDKATQALISLALRCLRSGGVEEIEAQRFATTAKNISHYLVRRNLRYRLSEFWFDLNDGTEHSLPHSLIWLAPLLRPWLWLKNHRRVRRLS